MQKKNVKIELERSGGFAGISRKYALDLEQLDPVERERLQGMIASAGFFDLPEVISSPNAGADQFSYTLTIRAGLRRHTVQASEPDIPEALQALINEILHQGREVKAH